MKLPNLVAAVAVAALSPAVLANETYRFDPSGSTIGFSVHQFLGTTHGKFTKFNGKIDVNREHPENSSVTAQIEARSIDTRIKKRDDHLRSAEFFNVDKYPQITFKSRSVKQTGPQSGDILGNLTIHGVTKPITLHVKLLTRRDIQPRYQHWHSERSEEWSEWDERHGRVCREGSGERVGRRTSSISD
ncbi:MAG: hypothetical protein DME64_09765 [Verrucomicrobia bacterium]|nr:MAG: hypothetical protein DME64_09765 [Verrucomicrobiota bacterium]